MNSKVCKKIRAHVKYISIEWLKSLLTEEEAKKITTDNYKNFMPKQTHVLLRGSIILSAFSDKWISKRIKKLLKANPNLNISSITMADLNDR